MVDSINQSYKIRGGVWIGFTSATWPWGVLEVSPNQMAIVDKSLKKEFHYTRDEIEKIEIKKYFPLIGYGIHIIPRDRTKGGQLLYFWYVGFRFKKLVNILKQLGWL